MGENVVVNVEFHGTNLGTINEIQVVPSDIAWEDLELMLKVYAGHEEEDKLIVKYRDDENDDVTISTQEELNEAFKVAKGSNNTLHLQVVCDVTPDSGTVEGNLRVQANVANQTVSMATSTTGNPDEVVSSGTEKAVGDITMEAETTKEEPKEISSSSNVDAVAMETNCAEETKKTQAPPVPPRRRQLFYLRHKATGFVLDINGGNRRPGTAVILWPRKPGTGPDNNNQLWYWDQLTMTIRSALNDLCLDVSDRRGVVTAYHQKNDNQQWTLVQDQIQYRFNPHLVVMAAHSHQGCSVVAGEAQTANPHTKWIVEYLEPGRKSVCTNQETGEQCPRNAKSDRPKVHDHARDSGVRKDGTRPKSRHAGSPKKGKKDSYAQLAVEIGKHAIFQKPGAKTPADDKKQSNSAKVDDGQAPAWFIDGMDKLKIDLTEDISKKVIKKTVSEVLQELTTPSSHNADSPMSDDSKSDKGEDQVFHHNIICDSCDRAITGIRYKCGHCEDYDLCEDCEATGTAHNPEHIFLKIRRPTALADRKKNGRLRPMLKGKTPEKDDGSSDRSLEKIRRKEEKLLHKCKKYEEKLRNHESKIHTREDKLKRHLESGREMPLKKEKLDLPQFLVVNKIDLECVMDESIPDGTRVQPGTRITKKWAVRNSGTSTWDSSCQLVMMWGNMSPVTPEVPVPHLKTDETGVVAVELTAPDQPGLYQSHWRLSRDSQRYGHRLWCSINVDPKEILEPPSEEMSMLTVSSEEKEVAVTSDPPAPVAVSVEIKSVSEPPTPAPCEKDDTIGELQRISSYETLTITERSRAKASQTATPNNTPRDVTPPKSPMVEPRGISSSSSVELVDPDEGSEQVNVSRMTELVQERMASLGLKPECDIELESWSSGEDGLDTDDTDSDFYVVPIPDCFNPELPPTSSASTSIFIKKDGSRSVDELLTASQSLESQPLLQPDRHVDPGFVALTADTHRTQSPNDVEIVDAIVVTADSTDSHPNQADYEPLPGQDGAESFLDITQDQDTGDGMVAVTTPGDLPSTEVNDQVEVTQTLPKVMEVAVQDNTISQAPQPPQPQASSEDIPTHQAEGIQDQGANMHPDQEPEAIQDEEETDLNANLPLDINENSAGTPNQEREGAAAQAPPTDHRQREASPPPIIGGEIVTQVTSAARDMASYAARTAQTAYSTASDVFRTLQARDEYVPPSSNWEPPQNATWTPPQSTWTPPENTWTPPEAPSVPEAHTHSPMDKLIDMGFANRDLNWRLLEKYNNDLEKVIADLVQGTESDWPAGRH